MSYDILSLKKKLLVKYPYFSSVLLKVKFVESMSVKTAQTNGKVIMYNPIFMNKLTLDQQLFILAHEICHIAFNHINRCKNKDERVWNLATDAVINAFLKKDGLKLVKSAIMVEDAINYDVESLYEFMMQKKREKNKNKNDINSFGDDKSKISENSTGSLENQNDDFEDKETNWEDLLDGDDDIGHDSHNNWYDDTLDNEDELNNVNDSEIESLQSDASTIGEKDLFKKNSQEKKQMLESLKETISNESLRNVGRSVGFSRPSVDWRYLLKEATSFDVDWSYNNAEFENGVLNPVLERFPVPMTEILLDTSGSINEELLRNFLRECKNILKVSKLRVGCFDTKFYGFYDIKTVADIDKMKFNGGGGTDFNIAVRAFNSRTDNKIIFTDGEADMPNISVNAVWVVFGDKKIYPRGGRVIRISNEQLKKLSFIEEEVSLVRGR